jgi:bifunctional non-homologous end joining protein LigD
VLKLRPMLASEGPIPRDAERYRFEIKWDGYRALVEIRQGQLVGLWSRRGRNMLSEYSLLRQLPRPLDRLSLVLDAELVGLDEEGLPRFHRMQLGTKVALFVFDVLSVGGRDVIGEDYETRRRRLDELELADERWYTVDTFDDGIGLFEATAEKGLEGIIAKRRDSRYECGKRSGAWIKTKNRRRGVFIVGGWLPQTSDSSRIGSLLVGELDDAGRLVFRGGVAGFDEREHTAMLGAFARAQTHRNPFQVGPAPPREARFLTPSVRVEVTYLEITDDGLLRMQKFERFKFE